MVEELVQRAREGDEDAFGELVKMYYSRIYGLAYSMAGNVADARDLSQQAWIKAWSRLPTFKGGSQFYTWMYRVATFVCLDFLRSRRRNPEFAVVDDEELDHWAVAAGPSGGGPRPDQEMERGEVREAFSAALETLSPEHRTALMLREVEGLSYDEIAKVMKCRKGTVMSRLFNARKRVQEAMETVR